MKGMIVELSFQNEGWEQHVMKVNEVDFLEPF